MSFQYIYILLTLQLVTSTSRPYVSQYPGMGIAVTTETTSYHPAPAPGFVVTQPIGSVPQVNYGTINSPPVPNYQPPPQTVIVGIPSDIRLVGGCSVCRIGVLEDNYPACAICCAIFFFPLGVLFCLALRNKRCSHCGVEF